eukprot:4925494-Pyramimonas_sp.AAC.1
MRSRRMLTARAHSGQARQPLPGHAVPRLTPAQSQACILGNALAPSSARPRGVTSLRGRYVRRRKMGRGARRPAGRMTGCIYSPRGRSST